MVQLKCQKCQIIQIYVLGYKYIKKTCNSPEIENRYFNVKCKLIALGKRNKTKIISIPTMLN